MLLAIIMIFSIVPVTADASGFIYIDHTHTDYNMDGICDIVICGKHMHQMSNGWSYNETGHYHGCKDSSCTDKLNIRPEFRMFHPSAPFNIGDGAIDICENKEYCLSGELLEKRRNAIKFSYEADGSIDVYTLSFKRCDLGMESGEPFRLLVSRSGKHNESLGKHDRTFSRLIYGVLSPDAQVFFVEE